MAAKGGKDAAEQALDTSDNSIRAGEEPRVSMEVNGGALVVDHRVDAAASNDNDGEIETAAASKNVDNDDESLAVPVARTLSHLELLIPVIMTYLLEFVDLPTRIKVASASTTMSRLVYQQCSTLWVKIEISDSTLPAEMARSLTDGMLAALLRRVNAWNTTKFLILRCSAIRGAGLEPLRQSPVLERCILHWPTSLNIATTTNILRTMLTHNLSEVELPSMHEQERVLRKEFLLELRQTVHQRAIDRGTECVACRHPVRDALCQIVPKDYGLPSTRCYKCLKHFCRTSACPVELRDCSSCGVASCGECDHVQPCNICQEISCNDCGEFDDCIYCNQEFCSAFVNCLGFASTCCLCNKTVCRSCSELYADDSIYSCARCEDHHCFDCRARFACSRCNEVFCSQDHEHARCRVCARVICIYCDYEHAIACNECGQCTCSDCVQQDEEGAWECLVCSEGSCRDCGQPHHCSSCDFTFCLDCHDYHLENCNMPRYKKRRTECDDDEIVE